VSRPPYLIPEPVAIGSLQAPARVVFGPHETNLGHGRAISPRHVAYYSRRAKGGTGVVITETASVTANDWPYERAPLATDCLPGWRSLVEACRPYGTLVLAALGHAGSQGSSAFSQEAMWAPSPVADVVSREPPAQLDRAAIEALVASFSWAAVEAMSAGLHGIEIDSGAWSILRQFQSGLTNQRGDGYGDDKLLLTRQVLSAVRHAIGSDRVLALRLSCDEMAPWAGITPEQAAVAVGELTPDLDLLTIVRAGPYSTGAYRPDAHTSAAFNLEICRAMRLAAAGSVRVVLQGSVIDPEVAEAALGDGTCDLVEMTRAQIAEPRLVALLRAGTPEQVRPCILCNQACRVRDNRNPIVSCVGEPSSGYDSQEPYEATPDPQGPSVPHGPSVMVVGAGPAGLECARVLAGAGRTVAVAERTREPGGVPLRAATGPGRERIRALGDWLAAECRRLGVDFSFDTEVTAADVEAARAQGWEVVLATGSRPFPDRYPPVDTPVVVDALELLMSGPGRLPPGPVVIDDPVGDQVGVGVAEWLAGGTDHAVSIVSPDPVAGTLLARTGDLADANVRLQRAGVTRLLHSRVRAIDLGDPDLGDADLGDPDLGDAELGRGVPGHVEVEDVWTGERTRLPAASLVDCGHRLAEDSLYRQIGDPRLLRAGDCVAPRSILEAVLEGRRVAFQVLGSRASVGAHG
jgi:mycofactocin system FadH/OYE family oxidoreductase 1